MTDTNPAAPADDPSRLTKIYGPYMTKAEVALELKYPTTTALRMARKRGVVKLQVVKVPGRRGSAHLTKEVDAALDGWMILALDQIAQQDEKIRQSLWHALVSPGDGQP